MSMSGSLMGYENNNDMVSQAKGKRALKPLPVVTSVNAAGVTTANGGIAGARARAKARTAHRKRDSTCGRGHVNSLWSVWYGIIAVAFQAYIAIRCTRRLVAYLSLPWPAGGPPPQIELHACLALAGAGVLLLPIFLAAAFLKLGNLANDGIKLGKHLTTCSRDPPFSLISGNADTGFISSLWRHSGPTSSFIHLCTAMCFLVPSLLMEARLIHAGFLPKEAIWRTDLDWVMTHRERLVVLSFMNIPENSSMGYYGTSQPFLEDDLDYLNNSTSNDTNWSYKQSGMRRYDFDDLSTVNSRENDSESSSDYSVTSSSSTTSTTPTPITRKPTSRMSARNVQRHHRPKSKKNNNMARGKTTPSTLFDRGNMSAISLPLSMNSLADLDHPENLNKMESEDNNEDYGPITLEYLNYAFALGVYTVRYPAVFWATNKPLGTIFSIQLVANSAQSLLAYAGMSVLYKVQVVGPLKALPLLRHRTIKTTSSTISNLFGDRFFLLNPHVTLGIFALSTFLVLCSSMLMYLYSYGRFTMFLNHERERRIILSKDTRTYDISWTYMTHPAALCLFLAISICNAPLLYDYTVVYRGSLDGAVLACICGTILHLLLWLVVWLCLALKHRWTFKLRVTIGRATVRSARSVKLVTDVDLLNSKDEEDGSAAPLLVVGNGRTYTVAETSPKKAIMGVIQKAAMERRARSQGNSIDALDGDSTADGEEQIYWLRPKIRPSPVQAGEKKTKQKVTFNDLPSTSGSRNKGKGRRDGGPDDPDGDYATLRELPLVTAHDDDNTSEENKLLECVNDDQVTYYASGNRDLQPSSEGETSPIDNLPDPPQNPEDVATSQEQPLPLPPPTPTKDNVALVNNAQQCPGAGLTPRCLRRADSGMPHDESLTPRSDASHSPPLDMNGGGVSNVSCSSNSETSSSGVHSSASSSQRRATSVEDLTNEPREEPHWRSCSLQRGTQPPSSSPAKMSNPGRVITNPNGTYASNPTYVNHTPIYNGTEAPCPPPVILENEATVVIRRKNSRPKLQEPAGLNEEPFGRSTNMRMTSFTENTDLRGIQASSATLPHYPTQPVVTYPHCSTMPLPHASHSAVAGSSMSGSCGSVQPRMPTHIVQPTQQQQPSLHNGVPSHTTLPSYHNGVRLMLHGGSNPFVKRFPPVPMGGQQPWAAVLPSTHHHNHHTFPQLPTHQMNGKAQQSNGQALMQQPRQSDRDSANFSMASSGDSDTCLPH